MHATIATPIVAKQLERFRELLRLLAALRQISEPLTTPQGLRKAITALLDLAVFLGLDDALVERIRLILFDEGVFQLVLAIVGYLAGVLRLEEGGGDGRLRLMAVDTYAESNVEARGFLEWLPFVLQLIELIRRLRQEA
ncbi:MAG: hypothetical protein WD847_15510 [Pirellulales bacterium]